MPGAFIPVSGLDPTRRNDRRCQPDLTENRQYRPQAGHNGRNRPAAIFIGSPADQRRCQARRDCRHPDTKAIPSGQPLRYKCLKGHKYITKGLKLLRQIRKAEVAHYTQATDIYAHSKDDSKDKVEQLSFRSGGKEIILQRPPS